MLYLWTLTVGLTVSRHQIHFLISSSVTFIKLTVDQVHIVWQVDRAAVEIALPNGIRYCSNDVPGKLHRKSSSVCMPQVYFKMLLASRNRPDTWYEAATAELDANLDIYSAPDGWQEHASAQRAFVAAQDMLTNRVGFLYNPEAEFSKNSKGSGMLHVVFSIVPVDVGVKVVEL